MIRYLAVIAGGGLAGLAGAYFSVVYTQGWAEGMTNGRGWIAIALVIFGTWDPIVVLLGALLFGFVDGLRFQLQGVGVPVSTYLLGMMPYVFTLVVLVATWTRMRHRHVGMPEALGLPYEREAR
jgi:simple sugar transport system permease protein